MSVPRGPDDLLGEEFVRWASIGAEFGFASRVARMVRAAPRHRRGPPRKRRARADDPPPFGFGVKWVLETCLVVTNQSAAAGARIDMGDVEFEPAGEEEAGGGVLEHDERVDGDVVLLGAGEQDEAEQA